MMGLNFRQWGIQSINHQVNLFIHLEKNHRSGESLLKERKASAATFLTE